MANVTPEEIERWWADERAAAAEAAKDPHPERTNLNLLRIPEKRGWASVQIQDHRADSKRVSCYFRDIRAHLLHAIASGSHIAGCVAWVSDHEILSTLSKKKGVALIVNKEEILRPDLNTSNWGIRHRVRAALECLPKCETQWFPEPLHGACDVDCNEAIGVRCVGDIEASTNMHHKFIVIGRVVRRYMGEEFEPRSVWTGSFNFTANASNSLENAVWIRDRVIAMHYLREFAQLAAASEPLGFTSAHPDPTMRID